MRKLIICCFFLFSCSIQSLYAFDETQLSVWANEAIVATYTFNDKNFMTRQKAIALYFNAQGWINYSAAFNASGLPATVQENHFSVTSVATLPPVVTTIAKDRWQAVMPLLVSYQNQQQQQKQSLQVTITFGTAPEGQGVRGLSIYSFQAVTITPPCECQPGETTTTNESPSPSSAVPAKK